MDYCRKIGQKKTMSIMKRKNEFKGHEIKLVNNEWFFINSSKSVKDNWRKISCGVCGEKSTKEGHDNCIGTLPGVVNACCGHGQTDEAYVMFSNGFILRSNSALNVISNFKEKTNKRINL